MAASIATLAAAPTLSQKQRRAILKKERRKRKRQAVAQAKVSDVNDEEDHTPDKEEDDDERAEEERRRLHEEWLERERLAQEEFKLKFEREEAARRRKEEEERMIKEEWETQQRREQEEKDQKSQEKRDREKDLPAPAALRTRIYAMSLHHLQEAVQKMLDRVESELENGPWMNPEAPLTEKSDNYGTERDIANCPFFLKTGACRFGDRCSRKHVHPMTSPTLMIRGMFVTFGMEQCRRDDYDTDACLEHSEEELQEYFIEFYHDVLPEFKSVGKVMQFKVSCNFEPHLKGNVYVQFDKEEQCRQAFMKFNGRWYAGRQLHCEICPVTRWKNAICGLFDRQRCPKGKHCNFLHVFRNPGNEFWEADRDLHMSPDRGGEGTYRVGRYSERYGDRSWRQRNSSRSPPRSERSYSRRGVGKRRSRSRSRERSRESRTSQHHRGASIRSNGSSWSRIGSSRRDRHRSRSRDKERDRSRSRDKDRERDRSRSRDKDRERDRSRSRGKDRERDRSRSRDKDRERDRSRSRGKDRERDRSRSRGKDGETGRSRSRDKERDKYWNRNRDKDRERDRSRSRDGDRERDRSKSRSRDKDRERDRSRSRSREREKQRRERSNNLSPENPDRKDKASDNTHTLRRHKHSKKSKKKSKKRRKKKSHSPEGMTSSTESEKEKELGEEGERIHSATNPDEEVNDIELVQDTGELGLNPIAHTKTETESTTEVKESHTEIQTEPSGNG